MVPVQQLGMPKAGLFQQAVMHAVMHGAWSSSFSQCTPETYAHVAQVSNRCSCSSGQLHQPAHASCISPPVSQPHGLAQSTQLLPAAPFAAAVHTRHHGTSAASHPSLGSTDTRQDIPPATLQQERALFGKQQPQHQHPEQPLAGARPGAATAAAGILA